jgi:hypothetical protein
MGNWAHPHQLGDMIWVKDWTKEPLQPRWTGPHLVTLATPTAVKVTGITPWNHHSQIKKAADPADLMISRLSMIQPTPQTEVPEDVTATHHCPRELQPCSSHLPDAG